MASKKEDKLHTPKEIRTKVETYIKGGLKKNAMVSNILRLVEDDSLGVDEVKEIVDEVADSFPSFELRQMIVDNLLVSDKDCTNARSSIYYIVDPNKGILNTIGKQTLGELFSKPNFANSTYYCEFVYEPYEHSLMYKDGMIDKFNMYNPPIWMKDYFYSNKPIDAVETLPVIYKDFLEHLVGGDKESTNYILDWLATAIKKRNYTILTTIGSQGTGKGVLGDIMCALVGKDNFTLTDNKLINKDFNGQLKNKRIVYLDEILVKTSSELNKFKSLINDTVEVESKGFDAVTVQNFASIYTSSNDMDAINLSADDRRFSIVNISDKKLKDNFNHVIGDLLIEENIEEFAKYLWYREVDDHRMLTPFKSTRTDEIMAATLVEWNDYFLNEYCFKYAGRSIALNDAAKDILEALDNYSYKIGRAAFTKLQAKYPEKFTITRPSAKKGKARRYMLNINKEQK